MHDLRECFIKSRKGLRIAFDIVPVSVKHVKIYQIDKAQTFKILIQIGKGLVDSVGIALRINKIGKPSSCKDVMNLADSDHVFARKL